MASCTQHYWSCTGPSSTVTHPARKVMKNKSCQSNVNRGGKIETCEKKEKWALLFLHLSALNSIMDKWLIVSIPGANRAGVGSNLRTEQSMFEGPYVFGWTLSHVQHFLVSSAISLPMTYLFSWMLTVSDSYVSSTKYQSLFSVAQFPTCVV